VNWNRRDAVSTLEELGFLLVSGMREGRMVALTLTHAVPLRSSHLYYPDTDSRTVGIFQRAAANSTDLPSGSAAAVTHADC
jgi:hypothetical protein